MEWEREEMRRGWEQGKHFRKEEEVNKLKNQILCTEVVFPLAQMVTQHAHIHTRRTCRDVKIALSPALGGVNKRFIK